MLDGIALDLRHLLRSLRRTPAFASIVILTLAIGIGATTAIVSVVDHVLVRSLPFADAGRLVSLFETDAHKGLRLPSNPTAVDWSADPVTAQAFEGVTYVRGDGARICIDTDCFNRGSAFVKPDFFPLMRPRLELGRGLVDDDQRSGTRAVVISHSLWKTKLGGDARAIGRSILIDSVPATVVGVVAAGAVYPTFADIWQPVSAYKHADILARRGNHVDSRTVGRLRPGIDSARATLVMASIGKRLGDAYPAEQGGWSATVFPVRAEVLGGTGPMLWTFGAAAVALLLLACANVAGLLLARMMTRGREVALRAAIGASRARLIGQLLTESLALALMGGLLGVAAALVGLRLASSFLSQQLPRADELTIDWRVLAIAAGATIITALLAGLWPAIGATRPAKLSVVRTGASGSVGSASGALGRRLLITAQFGIAVALLVSSALLIQSFRRAARVDVGFDPKGLYAFRIGPPAGSYSEPAEVAALYRRVIEAARTTPGVSDAAYINHSPFSGAAITTTFSIEGRASLDSSNQIFYRTVSAEYLLTMGMTMRSGRWFTEDDVRSPDGVYVINESAAKRYWPGSSAVGQHIVVARAAQQRKDFGRPEPGVVIGVVADVHETAQDVAPATEVYVPYTHEPWGWGMLMVRAAPQTIPSLARAIRLVDPRLLPDGPKGDALFDALQQSIESRLAPRRLSIELIGSFAAASLLLACIGLYGLVAYGVAQRTREMGVRKALGASDAGLVRLILRESALMILGGAVLGAGVAFAGTRLIRRLLFETSPADPAAYVTALGLLAGVAIIATLIPARRVTKLDPIAALRSD